ncbi:MAG: flagellar assembly protein H, partial [Acaryochloridaceae cyanobacterium CSU_3_4]|nr:flagellar assembly protein H [Acaryochloridaceae cyanobacterium CSU_3_4]
MAKNPFDQFSKQLLEEILAPFGAVEITLEVPGESQYVDVYFEPSVPPAIPPANLGLLGRIAQTPCLLEPFRNQPTPADIRSCLLKLYHVHGDYERKARREHEPIQESDLPHLWILASSASERLLSGFGVSLNEEWGSGVYFLHPSFRTAIIAINQLPRHETTLLLRLLGKGQTQKQAVDEVIAFDTREPRRAAILRLLANWKISIEITGQPEAEE